MQSATERGVCDMDITLPGIHPHNRAQRDSAAFATVERPREGGAVLGSFVDALTWAQALDAIEGWARRRESRYVCACNVHMVMSMRQDQLVSQAVNGADMVTPDGMPMAWMLRALGFPRQQRIPGTDLMWKYCEVAAATRTPVYFYGNTKETLDLLRVRLAIAFPDLRIAGMEAPPFRELTADEDAQAVDRINRSGAGMVFVGLGCPKQEVWMSRHRGRINAVMMGVGAAFNFHAGTVRRAPGWMQSAGLEWLHRLGAEPGRLWKRYLTTNVSFMLCAIGQLLRSR
jgi:N-acetylglucosaminyldiphosphoundecaprenol N-acetyl-beta-D-mannosaminyltransferase